MKTTYQGENESTANQLVLKYCDTGPYGTRRKHGAIFCADLSHGCMNDLSAFHILYTSSVELSYFFCKIDIVLDSEVWPCWLKPGR